MPTECKCGRTKCLSCLGTCSYCGDDIENYRLSDKKEERGKKLRRLLERA